MSSWLDRMSAKGILEEEEEEEEEETQNEPNNANEIISENPQIITTQESPKEKTTEINSNETETSTEKQNDGNNSNDYFTGKTTQEGLNFVRNIQKLEQMQDKAYSSMVNKVGTSLETTHDFASKILQQTGKTTASSNESKKKYQTLRTKVLSISIPRF